ncbi:hypothetical protein HS088_TW09G00352 [Tripterygium wilfordii]|uniref:DUF309 domain-containing protein n=1 Tax=Tripterygium wilfordii TaxID=458696 RepID=A0A7J7D7N3_TRIWF|nr:uncharacterized protein LOC120005116 [Tripterygium wilfordii]KAF5742308.1 hypothetical protein HS088_TW09G00352 [Tripterygium wilfordii]
MALTLRSPSNSSIFSTLKSSALSRNSKLMLCSLAPSCFGYNFHPNFLSKRSRIHHSFPIKYRISSNEEEDDGSNHNFSEAVELFNKGEFYKCHDVLESLWCEAEEPARTLFHGVLQCAVGLHHLFNQNHKGAMMELGEGVCKLRKFDFGSEPFHQFEQEISAVLEFIYQTQIELAACGDDICLLMEQSERSYRLLGGYGAGQRLYSLQSDTDDVMYIIFCHQRSYSSGEPLKVKLPILNATEEHVMACSTDH